MKSSRMLVKLITASVLGFGAIDLVLLYAIYSDLLQGGIQGVLGHPAHIALLGVPLNQQRVAFREFQSHVWIVWTVVALFFLIPFIGVVALRRLRKKLARQVGAPSEFY